MGVIGYGLMETDGNGYKWKNVDGLTHQLLHHQSYSSRVHRHASQQKSSTDIFTQICLNILVKTVSDYKRKRRRCIEMDEWGWTDR